MSDQPDSRFWVYLRRIGAKVDALAEDVADVKRRMTSLEIQVGNLAAIEASHYANTAVRLDAIDPQDLSDLIIEAWLCRAPKRVAAAYLKENGVK